MNQNFTSIHRNIQDEGGKKGLIIVPMHICEKFENMIETNTEIVDETTVLRKFKISKKTLQNYISSGKLKDCYTIAFNGSKWFCLKMLMGFKSLVQSKKSSSKAA